MAPAVLDAPRGPDQGGQFLDRIKCTEGSCSAASTHHSCGSPRTFPSWAVGCRGAWASPWSHHRAQKEIGRHTAGEV